MSTGLCRTLFINTAAVFTAYYFRCSALIKKCPGSCYWC